MRTVTTWAEFLDAVGPFLTSARPLEALKQAGINMGGAVAQAFEQGGPVTALNPAVLERLEAAYGPPPRTTLHVGRPRLTEARGIGGYRAVASANLAVLNDVLAELWRVRTIPNQLSTTLTNQAVTLADIRDACTGIPDDAVLGQLQITAPPVASASSITPLNLHFDIHFNLPIEASAPVSLKGVVHVEQPLDFQITAETEPKIRLSLGAIEELQAQLEVGSDSVLQPRSDEKRGELERKFGSTLRAILIYLFYDKAVLAIPGAVSVSSTFPNSKVTVSQIGVVSVRNGSQDFVIVGINVDAPVQGTDPSALVAGEVPVIPNNVHAVVDQEFANDALSAIITSGDLAALINRIIARHSGPFSVVPIVVKSGSVTFESNLLRVSIDCVAQGACALRKDLNFTATVSGTPGISDGTVTIEGSDIELDVDNWDAVVCTILSVLWGPFGLILNLGVLAFIAAYNPTGKNLEFPTSDTSKPLPGSEQDFKIQLTGASVNPGTMIADGQAGLVPDTLRAFVYLRVVTGFMSVPVAGATVELIELNSPAPASDDVVIPPVGETDSFTSKFEIDDVTSYAPLPDQSLGTKVTDESGYVRFAEIFGSAAGMYTDVRTTTTLRTDETSTTTTKRVIEDPTPDFAVTITDANGTVLAKRLLISLNNPGKRLGSPDHPFVVHLKWRPTWRWSAPP